mmetsp:Transcript_11704/g.47255  ORF Transcript_11704/g.47255 Transcript_11704/m.47255 type:complete len:262 (+) Transcript_11704:1357-2142(+)
MERRAPVVVARDARDGDHVEQPRELGVVARRGDVAVQGAQRVRRLRGLALDRLCDRCSDLGERREARGVGEVRRLLDRQAELVQVFDAVRLVERRRRHVRRPSAVETSPIVVVVVVVVEAGLFGLVGVLGDGRGGGGVARRAGDEPLGRSFDLARRVEQVLAHLEPVVREDLLELLAVRVIERDDAQQRARQDGPRLRELAREALGAEARARRERRHSARRRVVERVVVVDRRRRPRRRRPEGRGHLDRGDALEDDAEPRR